MTKIVEVGNFDNSGGHLILEDAILDVHKSIAYLLSDENRSYLQEWELEKFAVHIAMLAILAEKSKFGPGIKDTTIQKWRTLYFTMYDERYEYKPDKPDVLRKNILDAFERLETIARLHPPSTWYDD